MNPNRTETDDSVARIDTQRRTFGLSVAHHETPEHLGAWRALAQGERIVVGRNGDALGKGVLDDRVTFAVVGTLFARLLGVIIWSSLEESVETEPSTTVGFGFGSIRVRGSF